MASSRWAPTWAWLASIYHAQVQLNGESPSRLPSVTVRRGFRHAKYKLPPMVWDAEARGLCVRVYGDGSKSFIFVYRTDDRQRFLRIGNTPIWSLEAARERAKELSAVVDQGRDPASYNRAFLKLIFASRCEGTQRVPPCNTRGWILARSSKNPENGALGSLERTADLRMPLTENYRNLYPALIRHRQSMP
jgi:hypothetical protein